MREEQVELAHQQWRSYTETRHRKAVKKFAKKLRRLEEESSGSKQPREEQEER